MSDYAPLELGILCILLLIQVLKMYFKYRADAIKTQNDLFRFAVHQHREVNQTELERKYQHLIDRMNHVLEEVDRKKSQDLSKSKETDDEDHSSDNSHGSIADIKLDQIIGKRL